MMSPFGLICISIVHATLLSHCNFRFDQASGHEMTLISSINKRKPIWSIRWDKRYRYSHRYLKSEIRRNEETDSFRANFQCSIIY